jgi:hypothetical protein
LQLIPDRVVDPVQQLDIFRRRCEIVKAAEPRGAGLSQAKLAFFVF